MNDRLEQTILEMVRTHLRSLSDSSFLALTCNLTDLSSGLIHVVYDEVIRRQTQEINKPPKEQQFKYLNKIVAAIFDRTTRRIKQIMEKTKKGKFISTQSVKKAVLLQRHFDKRPPTKKQRFTLAPVLRLGGGRYITSP